MRVRIDRLERNRSYPGLRIGIEEQARKYILMVTVGKYRARDPSFRPLMNRWAVLLHFRSHRNKSYASSSETLLHLRTKIGYNDIALNKRIPQKSNPYGTIQGTEAIQRRKKSVQARMPRRIIFDTDACRIFQPA